MGKDYYKFLGVNKAATAGRGIGKQLTGAGGKGKGTGGVPLTGNDCCKSLGVNKAANAGAGGAKGAIGAGGHGCGGASTLSPTDHSTFKTAVKVTNEFYYEEENRSSFEDKRSTFSSTEHSKTGLKVTHEYYQEEDNRRLSEDGDKEEGEDIQDDDELLADEDNDGAELGDGGSGEGDYSEDDGIGDDDDGTVDVDDYLNGDNYYYDVAAAGFDYDLDDGGDGDDGWW